MNYNPRLTIPEKGNKYYITKSKGGYSTCIDAAKDCKESLRYEDLNVLPNCVGYACGRFNEIIGQDKQVYALNCNAENFVDRAKKLGLSVGTEPKLGAIIVWSQGSKSTGKDGYGHVEVVEQIQGPNQIIMSASGYNLYTFKTKTRRRNSGGTNQWGMSINNEWKFLGFIYNPNVEDK